MSGAVAIMLAPVRLDLVRRLVLLEADRDSRNSRVGKAGTADTIALVLAEGWRILLNEVICTPFVLI